MKSWIIVIIAVLLSFCLLSIFISPIPNSTNITIDQILKKEDTFYSNFEKNDKSIFLIGSSMVGRFNHTYIQEQINKEKGEYTIFNLAISDDYPTNRLSSISKIISLTPDLVVYGISHRVFADEILKSELIKPKSILPDPTIYLKKSIQNFEEIFGLNFERWNSAKQLTINLIKNTMGMKDMMGSENLLIENSPFYHLRKSHMVVLDDLSLKRSMESNTSQLEKIYHDHENVSDLKKIIKNLQHENIPIILFSVPLSDIMLNSISNNDQKIFEDILKKISEDEEVKVVFLHDKFRYAHVWNDPHHLAYGSKSNSVNDSIVTIIMESLE
jgi:hypothetical protein